MKKLELEPKVYFYKLIYNRISDYLKLENEKKWPVKKNCG